jgi:hypothetical protein
MMRPLLDSPRFIPQVRFENPTAYDLEIDVATAQHDGWMPVGTARRNGTTIAQEIFDIGDVWIFRFAAQGEIASELRISRAALERNQWRVPIPAVVGRQLQDKGAPLPPP